VHRNLGDVSFGNANKFSNYKEMSWLTIRDVNRNADKHTSIAVDDRSLSLDKEPRTKKANKGKPLLSKNMLRQEGHMTKISDNWTCNAVKKTVNFFAYINFW